MDAQIAANRFRAVAYAFRDFTEQPPNTNRGQVVDRFLEFTGYDPKDNVPWCACYVYYCGYWAFYDHVSKKSAWPLPKTGGCAVLGSWAKKKEVLMTEPQPGDVFLTWYASKGRFAHTGIVVGPNPAGGWITIEGNTSGAGSREGWGVFERVRHFKKDDRFIRWTGLV
jgi:hypothetical protein